MIIRLLAGLWVVGMLALMTSNAKAGDLLNACTDIRAKAADASGRLDAILACMEKLATEVEARPKIPSGAVIAFDQQCPKNNWELYDRAGGRFLVGAGHHSNKDSRGTELTIYQKHRLNGGEEAHKLTIPEMPSHKHEGKIATGGFSFEHGQNNSFLPVQLWSEGTGEEGQDGFHNNMPPYIALYFCRKK